MNVALARSSRGSRDKAKTALIIAGIAISVLGGRHHALQRRRFARSRVAREPSPHGFGGGRRRRGGEITLADVEALRAEITEIVDWDR
jgi:hypothetical protein